MSMFTFIRPEFFDIFGVAVFGFITVLSSWSLAQHKPVPKWTLIVLLTIGILGLLVDGSIVYTTYLQ